MLAASPCAKDLQIYFAGGLQRAEMIFFLQDAVFFQAANTKTDLPGPDVPVSAVQGCGSVGDRCL